MSVTWLPMCWQCEKAVLVAEVGDIVLSCPDHRTGRPTRTGWWA